ncbi:MAG: sugar ABC transporter ATP-binding protein [Enterobacteriaceae bacterium]
MSQPLLQVRGLSKQFSGIVALDNVHLSVRRGEVHALLGENGAGKSTLLKALSGAQPQDQGEIDFDGERLSVTDSPMKRHQQGIVTIYQEFNLLPNMTVAENLFLGREMEKGGLFVDKKGVEKEAQTILDYLRQPFSATAQGSRLSVAQQQMVEIARALTLNAKLIIMDEPSAALSDHEVETLHQVVREVCQRGVAVIYVTHRLHEVFQLCDRFTVLQDGRFTGEGQVRDVKVEQIIQMMVGRNVLFQRRDQSLTQHQHRPVRLEVKDLSRRKSPLDPHGISLKGINFKIHEGEILGIAGLVGAGRTELARCLFGADQFSEGEVWLDGERYQPASPQRAFAQGVALVPEDRKKDGLILKLSIRNNMTLPKLGDLRHWWGFINNSKENALIDHYRQALKIKMNNSDQEVRKLSGGNQQKVILARCMALHPRVLIIDEPTRGIDIGAKSEVHQVLFDMAAQGVAVLVISSDLPEIMAISDRIITLCEGKVTGALHGDEATEEKLMTMMAIGMDKIKKTDEVTL